MKMYDKKRNAIKVIIKTFDDYTGDLLPNCNKTSLSNTTGMWIDRRRDGKREKAAFLAMSEKENADSNIWLARAAEARRCYRVVEVADDPTPDPEPSSLVGGCRKQT